MEVPADALQPKVIEKEVVVEKLVGVSEEEVQRLKVRSRREPLHSMLCHAANSANRCNRDV